MTDNPKQSNSALNDTLHYLIVGGGSAGCALAARLSEDTDKNVLLIEAGPDITEDSMPDAIRAAYPSRAFFTSGFFHPNLFARFGDAKGSKSKDRTPARYEQARVLGGGSTINGLVGNRGAPGDYDEWVELGATGWSWNEVLPYFRKLERDLDFDGAYHGKDGPVPVQRLKPDQRTGFVKQSFTVMKNRGYTEISDQNAQWQDGIMPAAITVNEQGHRASAATCYLTPIIRARKNLEIRTDTEVVRLRLENGAASGVEITGDNTTIFIPANETILCCGAINTPALMMRSGIGPAQMLQELNIEVVKDAPQVGKGLHEHPALGISCFIKPGNRNTDENRHHTQAHLRFTSGMEGCPPGDMKMAVLARSAWHAVGRQLATFYLWVNKPYSLGEVTITSANHAVPPNVDFHLLSDERDMQRMRDAFRLIADIARDPGYDNVRHEVFPTIFSDHVRKVSRPTLWNAFQTAIFAKILDIFGFARALLIQRLIAPVRIETLLNDDKALDDYLNKAVVGVWHPVGTCRMGKKDDPAAVTDPAGKVHGVDSLRVCDASLMPAAVRANTNLPTIMIAERIADFIKQGR